MAYMFINEIFQYCIYNAITLFRIIADMTLNLIMRNS